MHYGFIFPGLVANIESIISHGGYVLLSVFTILEGIPMLGMVIPGHIAIITGGFLAKIGTLDLIWVIIISTIGAIIGDCIGFYLGRKYGLSFIDRLRPFFSITDLHIEKAQNLLNKHTGKAMIIGRFIPATRSLMPFLVGTMHTHAKRFWFFNIIGGISWVISSVLIGYIFGTGYHMATGYFGRFSLIAILIAIVIVWGYRFVNTHFRVFKSYELFTLALNILSLGTFTIVIDQLTDNSFRLGFDIWVSNFMCNLVHPINACLGVITPDSPLSFIGSIFVSIAYWISTLGGTVTMTSLGMAIGIWLIIKKKWRSATVMLLSIGSTGFFLLFLKDIFNITRPGSALQMITNDPSFPSGHAGMAAAFFVILAYLLAPKITSWIKRELMIVSCVLLIILIGLSRLILNVHWTTDIIAGWSLGVFMATASILLVRYFSFLLIKKNIQ